MDVETPLAPETRRTLTIPARDGYPLAATEFGDPASPRVAVLSGAVAVPRAFYRRFAQALADRGYRVVTYDYRGVGGSRPAELRGFEARARDWALSDQAGVLDHIRASGPDKLVLIGHSFGGQVAGMLDDARDVAGMLTLSSQSGHWRLQGGYEPVTTFFHTHVTMPLLAWTFGYMPWSLIGAGEDLPKGVVLEWARWCRDPKYLLGDDTLPLDRYSAFTAPVMAYSIDDDTWGTARSVDAMMGAYPNVQRRHLVPSEVGMDRIGHMGFFRRASRSLWNDAFDWLDAL
ncbi:MAG: alpha/beta fold hydrolase [Myxococcota bacterium]